MTDVHLIDEEAYAAKERLRHGARSASQVEFVAAFIDCLRPTGTEETLDDKRKAAWGAIRTVEPKMIDDGSLKTLYEILIDRFAAGKIESPAAIVSDLSQDDNPNLLDTFADIADVGNWRSIGTVGETVVKEWQIASLRSYCQLADEWLLTAEAKDGGKKLGQQLATKVMTLYAPSGSRIDDPEQVIDRLIERAEEGEDSGVPVPYPVLNESFGPLIPGEVLGVTAYSGSGKSTFAANLFARLVRRRYPCLAFPTEMGPQFLERAIAAEVGVEQRRAEKRMWKDAPDQFERYKAGAMKFRELSEWWHLIEQRSITPIEIASTIRVLRKRWSGRPVVVFVDHMHRLDYGDEEADDAKGAAAATKMFKNMAGDDDEGGLIFVLLFQPRKPDVGKDIYGFVTGDKIRGHSGHWNELDHHISPGRLWVETNTQGVLTPWGSKKARVKPGSSFPVFTNADPTKGDRKVDDERFWVRVDKRRIGGEDGVKFLSFQPQHGRIYEKYADDGVEPIVQPEP